MSPEDNRLRVSVWCKENPEKNRVRVKRYRDSHLKHMKTKNKIYRENNPEKMRELKRIAVLRKYGLTQELYDKIFLIQNNLCAICGASTSKNKRSRRFYIDHNHLTGEVRGVLCLPCNFVLGFFEKHKTPVAQVFLDYLAAPPARMVIPHAA